MPKGKKANLTGQAFGKLTVLGLSDKRGSRGSRTVPLWECRCECGAITYKATDVLKNSCISMCSACAARHATSHARQNAGFIEGTQLSKIQSSALLPSNTSGHRGVYYESRFDRWRAEIKFQRKRYYLGSYKNKDDAIKARLAAEEELFEPFLEKYAEKQA